MELTFEGRRVLGALIEKALATPQQYPLSLNALQAACNQRNNRDPVVDWDGERVRAGIDDLKGAELVKTVYARGSRTPKYEHRADEQLDLDTAQLAVLAVLLLRGPQTPGELRARADRMHGFSSLEQVDDTLTSLAEHHLLPLATVLPRQPGQKEARHAQLLGGAPTDPVSDPGSEPAAPDDAVAHLRGEVEELRETVGALRAQLAAVQRVLDDLGMSTAEAPDTSSADGRHEDDAGR